MMLYRNLTAVFWVMFTTSIAPIHLVKMLITMNKNLNPPAALGKILMISISHIAKGQERLIGRRGFACFIVCFWKN
jgi:hypothetical protein